MGDTEPSNNTLHKTKHTSNSILSLNENAFFALYLVLAKFEVPPIYFLHPETLDSK